MKNLQRIFCHKFTKYFQLQRQLHKKALSGVVVDEYSTEDSRRFSVSELRELFAFKESKSVIHDSLNCKRCVNGIEMKKPEKGSDPTDLGCWNHTEKRNYDFSHDNDLRL